MTRATATATARVARRAAARLTACALAPYVLAAACSTPTGAEAPAVGGAWTGGYVEAVVPPRALDARLQLTQDGVTLRGTVLLADGRAAEAAGPIVGRRLALGLTYTGDCAGTARWVLDLSADGTTFTGTAESSDCRGATRADLTLARQ